jgi:hypothetical protein
MTMAKRFKNISCKCIFCYERVADNCNFVLARGAITLDDFGVQPVVVSPTTTKIAADALHFANCHYAFDLLMGISFLRLQNIEETELFNAYEYFGGLRGMVDLAKENLHNQDVMKEVGLSDKSLIETAIIMVQNEIKKVDELLDRIFGEDQEHQVEEVQEVVEEEVVEEVVEVVEEVVEVVEEPKHSYDLRPRKRRIVEI